MTLTISSTALKSITPLLNRLKCRATLPILEHVLITVLPGEIEATLQVTDLDIGLASRVPISGPTTPGVFTIPLAELTTLARLADKDTHIRLDCTPCEGIYPVQSTSTAKGLRSHRQAFGLPPGEFPPFPQVDAASVIFPTALFEAIQRVRPAASKDETRYVLNGVFLDSRGAIIATDGRRLAAVTARVPVSSSIIPNKAVAILGDPALAATPAAARFTPELASFKLRNHTLITRLIEGNYPNYHQVIPNERNGSCTFTPATAQNLIAWLAPLKIDSVKLTFAPTSVHLTAKNRETEVSTTVPALITDQVPTWIAFNPAFLAQGLAMGLHTIDLIDEMSPGLLTDGTARYVIMPMRVTTEAPAEEEPTAEPTAEAPTEAPTEDKSHESHESYPVTPEPATTPKPRRRRAS